MGNANRIAYKIFLFICIAFSFLCTSGCDQEARSLRKKLAKFEQTSISLSPNLLKIQSGKVSLYSASECASFVLIQLIGPMECTECRVANLKRYQELFELSYETGVFDFMIIISPNAENLDDIIHKLIEIDGKYPVYVDINSDFIQHNRIPEDARFHSFLIDDKHKPIFVGDPISSDKLMSLFMRYIGLAD